MDKQVTIIDAGPVGLVCADVLTHNGVEVTVYDRYPEAGGLLTFDIPSFKLGKSPLAHRREVFSMMGIHFEFSCEVGKDVSLNSLLEQYDMVFVGVGTYHSMKAGLPNEDAPNVYDVLSFFIANTRQVMGLEKLPGELFVNTTGPNVVALGGGGTAIGCVRAALCHGVSNVICAYRRNEANMSGSKEEMKNARGEGVDFEFNVQPMALELNKQGHVYGIRFLRTRFDEPDVQGRRCPVPVGGSEFVTPADAAIMTFGFNPHGMPWLESYGVTVDKWGRIIADVESQYRYQTTDPKILAGGDAVCGVDPVITAITEGRHAVQGIIDRLGVESAKFH